MPVQFLTQDDFNLYKQEVKDFLEDKLSQIMEQAAQNPQLPVYLKSRDVCRQLKISAGTLQTLRKNGTLPFSRLQGSIRYLREDILEMVKKNSEKLGCLSFSGIICLHEYLL